MRTRRGLAAVALALFAGACGHASERLPHPLRFGAGPRFHPPAFGGAVVAHRPIGGLACSTPPGWTRYVAHVEVIAHGRVVLVPAGIGIAPPQSRQGAYVRGGRCEYPLRTHEPTGLVEVALARTATLGDLFRVWGQPLSRGRVLGFAAPAGRTVAVFVGTRRRPGDPRTVPIGRHSAVTIEVGRFIPPRPRYAFPRRSGSAGG